MTNLKVGDRVESKDGSNRGVITKIEEPSKSDKLVNAQFGLSGKNITWVIEKAKQPLQFGGFGNERVNSESELRKI